MLCNKKTKKTNLIEIEIMTDGNLIFSFPVNDLNAEAAAAVIANGWSIMSGFFD